MQNNAHKSFIKHFVQSFIYLFFRATDLNIPFRALNHRFQSCFYRIASILNGGIFLLRVKLYEQIFAIENE